MQERIKCVENKISQIESQGCSCSILYEKRIAKLEKVLGQLQLNNTRTRVNRDQHDTTHSDTIEYDQIDDETNSTNDVITNADDEITINRFTRNEKAIVELAVFERSNYDGLLSIESDICKFEAHLQKLKKVTDGLIAMQETHTTAIFETQKQIIDQDSQIKDCEALLTLNDGHNEIMHNFGSKIAVESADEIETDFMQLSAVFEDFAYALQTHNNTIKTHFELNEAYNEEIMRKINLKLNRFKQSQGNTSNLKPNKTFNRNKKKQQTVKTNTKIDIQFGPIAIKPFYRNSVQSDKIKIYIDNTETNTTIDEIRSQFNDIFKRHSDELKNGEIKWHTNKITYNPEQQQPTRAILIAILPVPINVSELISHVGDFFGNTKRRDNKTSSLST